jgi:NADPH:quinone reductase-like Zn-dependent oxidoreductase
MMAWERIKQYGTYAELICVPTERVFPAPPEFSPQQSAAFAVDYLMSWIGLMSVARRLP